MDEELAPTLLSSDVPDPSQPALSPSADAPSRMTPESRYEQVGALGEGGMGSVLLCNDRQIGRRIAKKTLKPELSSNAGAVARFVREARVQGQLEHPAVLPVYDLGVDADGEIYFTMKRVKGHTLHDVIEALKAGDPQATADYDQHRLLSDFARICLAVDFAHQHGVVHRDLKPANVMMGDFGEVYVVDWGLAKVLSQADLATDGAIESGADGPSSGGQTRAGALLGTPGYMAPEQTQGDPDLGPAADIYALGAILFEVLSLEPLHSGGLGELIVSTTQGVDARPTTRVPEREIPPELDAICVRATQFDPTERYPTARALHDAVDGFLKGTRDAELRRQSSARHAESAAELSRNTLEGRREAMQELGRALALDPDNRDALEMLAALLSNPPSETPVEVERALREADEDQLRRVARMAIFAYASLFVFLPVYSLLSLVRSGPLVAFFSLTALCCILASIGARWRGDSMWIAITLMFTSSAMFACLYPLFGSLLLVAPALMSNALAYALIMKGPWRIVNIAVHALYIVGPLALESMGVWPARMLFSEGTIILTPSAIVFEEVSSLVFLASSCISSLVIAAWIAMTVRVQLRQAEKKLHLHAWQVKALLPAAE